MRNNFSGRVRGGFNAGFRDGFQIDPALSGNRRFHGMSPGARCPVENVTVMR